MVYKGHVEQGTVVLDEAVTLPEGAAVQIELVADDLQLQTLKDGLLQFAGTVNGLPEDLAANHDQYAMRSA